MSGHDGIRWITSDFRSYFLIGPKNTDSLSHSSRPYLPSLAGDSLTTSCVLNLSFPTAKFYILTTKIFRGIFNFYLFESYSGLVSVTSEKTNLTNKS